MVPLNGPNRLKFLVSEENFVRGKKRLSVTMLERHRDDREAALDNGDRRHDFWY
jgi:hypothetical protein